MDPFAPPILPPPLQQLPPMDPPPAPVMQQVPHTVDAPPPATSVPTATPPPPTSSHGHPPYAQMITEAITALKERNGSSKVAIAKYIDRVYSSLPSTHSALLTHHLKKLKESGQLVMVKHSYKLAGSTAQVQVQSNGSKKRPGRPPKAKPDVATVQPQPVPQPQAQAQPPVNAAGGTGVVPESVFASLGLVDGPASASKRRPGRPKKADVGNGGLQPSPVAVPKKSPGRPPKNVAGNAADPGAAVGRPRGRQPKNAASSGKPRGRPPKNVAASGVVGDVAGPLVVATGYVADTATVTEPATPSTSVKKRGRPKSAGGLKKQRKLSGKPLGRPKKTEPTTAVQVSNLQQLMAYQELRSKLEFFQSRIRQTVGVLRPYLDGQNAANALAALQELEELAAIDVTAPLNLQNRQPTMPASQV